MKKRRILLILSSPEYISNFIGTQAIQIKKDDYEVSLLVPQSLKNRIPVNLGNKIYTLSDSVFEFKKDSFLFFSEILGYRNRNKSKSFLFREKRNTSLVNLFEIVSSRKSIRAVDHDEKRWTHNLFHSLRGTISDFVFLCLVLVKIKVKKHLVRLLSRRFVFPLVERLYASRMRAPEELIKFLVENPVDVVTLPTAAYEPIVTHLALAKPSVGFQYLLIADNWDNLSSKTVLWQLSDYIATWGTQSSEHAVRIQGYQSQDVFEIGTARFHEHSEARLLSKERQENSNYILFVGNFLKFNELRCLKILSNEILENSAMYGELEILYRPHPFRPLSSLEALTRLDRVKTIPIFGSISYQQSLDQILNSKFVIGGLSSMLIECSLLGKNYLALTHREIFNLTSPKRVLQSYEHFSGISNLPNLFMAHRKSDLRKMFRVLFNSENCPQPAIDEKLNHFYRIDNQTYSQRFYAIIDQICSKQSIKR